MTADKTAGVMICGHGGREADTVLEFNALVADVALRLPQFKVESGFLEFAKPDIRGGLEKLRRAGCASILAIPGTLFSGAHARRDIPAILQNHAAQFPEIPLRYGRAFDEDERLIRAACARVNDALEAAPGGAEPEKTALLVAGRGASEPGALAKLQAISRHIRVRFNFSCAGTAYAGIALPRVPDALERIAGLGYKRVVVLPYFLFTGMLVKRIYDETDLAAARHRGVQFVKCAYLNNHPLVTESFVEQIIETSRSGTLINA